MSGTGGVEKISSVQRNLLAKRRLVQLINNRAKLLALCSCILWHHAGVTSTAFKKRSVLMWNYPRYRNAALTYALRCYRDLFVCAVAPSGVLPVALYSLRPQGLTDAWCQFVQITPRRWCEMIL